MQELDAIQGTSLCAMTLETRSHKDVCSVICFLCLTHTSPTEIHHKSIEIYGDSTVRVQYVRKWSRELENGQTDAPDNCCTSQTSTSGQM